MTDDLLPDGHVVSRIRIIKGCNWLKAALAEQVFGRLVPHSDRALDDSSPSLNRPGFRAGDQSLSVPLPFMDFGDSQMADFPVIPLNPSDFDAADDFALVQFKKKVGRMFPHSFGVIGEREPVAMI